MINQYDRYIFGQTLPAAAPVARDPLFPNPDSGNITPIDFSTILNDLDGTLTGMIVADSSGKLVTTRTSSVSENRFFDAPAQDPECKSFGVQTSAYDFTTTVMSKLQDSGRGGFVGSGPWFQDFCSGEKGCASSDAWNRNESFNSAKNVWEVTDGGLPAIPIYRQYVLSDDMNDSCTAVCTADGNWACDRASFMIGTTTGSAPYLTVNHGLFYIDTASPSENGALVPPQNGIPPSRDIFNPRCVPKQSDVVLPAFKGGESYVLWHIFANDLTSVTYQIHVGTDFGRHN